MSDTQFGYAFFSNDPRNPYPRVDENGVVIECGMETIQVLATHQQLRHIAMDQLPRYCQTIPDDLVRDWNLGDGDLVEYRDENGLSIVSVNGLRDPAISRARQNLSDVLPDFPSQRIPLDQSPSLGLRIVDIYAPIAFSQKVAWLGAAESGKTWGMCELVGYASETLTKLYPNLYIIVVLVGERPEEIGEYIKLVGAKGEVLWSRFDDPFDMQVNVAEMGIARGRGLCQNQPVMVFIDSITRLAAAYGATDKRSPWTSGGASVGALFNARVFLGGAGNYPKVDGLNGGTLTVIASMLCDGTDKGQEVAADSLRGASNNIVTYVNPDKAYRNRMLRPSIDLGRTHARNEHRYMTQEEMGIRLEIQKLLDWADGAMRLETLIDVLKKCATLESVRDELKARCQPNGPKPVKFAAYLGEAGKDGEQPQRNGHNDRRRGDRQIPQKPSIEGFTERDYNSVSGGAYHVSKFQANRFNAAKITPAELKSLVVEKGLLYNAVYNLANGGIEHELVERFLTGSLMEEDFHL